MQAACSRLAGRVAAHGAGSSSCISLGRRQGALGTPLACGLATMVRPPSVRDAQTRIFGWAQPDVRRGESRQGHAPLKTLEKLKRHGLIGQKVRARSCVAAWRDLDLHGSVASELPCPLMLRPRGLLHGRSWTTSRRIKTLPAWQSTRSYDRRAHARAVHICAALLALHAHMRGASFRLAAWSPGRGLGS